jgi:hypothetical protein
MARLADRIWEMEWVPPQVMTFRPEFRDPDCGAYSLPQMRAVMEDQREAIAAVDVYSGDAVLAWFCNAVAAINCDLKMTDFPALANPSRSMFLEFRRPTAGLSPAGTRLAAGLPHSWGWLLAEVTPTHLETAFDGCVTPVESARTALVGQLWYSPDGAHVFAPLASVALQRGTHDELVAVPSLGLAFRDESAHVLNRAELMKHAAGLLFPVLASLAFLACRTTRVVDRSPSAKQARSRRRHGKRPLCRYREIDFGVMADRLRFEGQSGLVGLAAALRACRYHFVQESRPLPPLATLPTDGPLFVPPG